MKLMSFQKYQWVIEFWRKCSPYSCKYYENMNIDRTYETSKHKINEIKMPKEKVQNKN
jgi:hypothetical protein